jgi:hypothetical protein
MRGAALGDYIVSQIDTLTERIAEHYGYLLSQRVLIDLRVTTANLPYALIDRHGLLVVDLECFPGSTITGTSSARLWSAKSSTLGKVKFENPLLANLDRCEALREAFSICGRQVPAHYITSAVMFLGADLSQLKLDPADQARVMDARHLEDWVRTRGDFPPNEGALEEQEIRDLHSLLKALDRSDNDEVRARHAEGSAKAGSYKKRASAQVNLTDSITGTAPPAPRLSPNRYPGIEQAVLSRSTSLIALLALVAVAVWLFVYGGYGVVSLHVTDWTQRAAVGIGPAPQEPAAPALYLQPNTAQAKERLTEAAPHLLPRIRQADSPYVSERDGAILYTWEYTEQAGSVDAIGTFTLGLDLNGNVVHVDQREP